MESRAKLLGHPVHQMLIVFPLGLLATAVIIDIVYFVAGALIFAELSYYLIIAGLIGGTTVDWGLVAASAVVFALPVLVFAYLVRKHLVAGVTLGAVRR